MSEIDEEKQQQPEEETEEAQVIKPVEQQTPAKNSADTTAPAAEQAQEETAANDEPAPSEESPQAEPAKAEESVEEESIIDIMPTADQTEKPILSAAETSEPAAKPSEPQHPGILHLKSLIQDARNHLVLTKTMTKKMLKQLKKLEASLEKLPKRLRKLGIKDAAKAEKYLFRLRERIGSIPAAELKRKGVDRLSEDICKLRKKLPTGKV